LTAGVYYYLTRGRYRLSNSYDLYLQVYNLELEVVYESHVYTATRSEMDSFLHGLVAGYKQAEATLVESLRSASTS